MGCSACGSGCLKLQQHVVNHALAQIDMFLVNTIPYPMGSAEWITRASFSIEAFNNELIQVDMQQCHCTRSDRVEFRCMNLSFSKRTKFKFNRL